MKHHFLIPVLCSVLILTGCSTPGTHKTGYVCTADDTPAESPAAQKVFSAKKKVMQKNDSVRHFQAPEGRKMTFTADISLQVADAKKAAENTRQLIMEEGGYVKSMNNTTLVLAVPVKKGEWFLEKIAVYQ